MKKFQICQLYNDGTYVEWQENYLQISILILLFQYNRMSFRKLQFKGSASIHTCLLFYLLFLLANTLNNLITPLDNLTSTLTQTSTSQFPYNYQQLPNTPTWHSLTSPTLLLRNLPSMTTSSVALDTANNNRYNKICYPLSSLQVSKYQLSFKYLIDGNTDRAKLVVTWNAATVLQKIVSHVYVMEETYFVNGKGDGTDVMCLEGWAYNDLLFYGVLVYDFVVAKIVDVYVLFDARVVQEQLNTIQLVSNLTVNDSNTLSILQSYTTLQIPTITYSLQKISVTQTSKLSLTISLSSQPSSNPASQPQIQLPTHRNPQLNLQSYIISCKTLPRLLYISESDVSFLNDTLQYVILVTRVYNVGYRLVRLLGFAFVGVRLWMVQMVFGGLAWLDVGAIGGHVRRILTQIMKNSQYSKTFGYFLSQLNIQPFNFGSQHIKISQQIPSQPPRSPTFTTSFLSPSLPQLLTDNLILSLLNILKLYILTSWIYNNSPSMKKLLTNIQSHKIHYQFITILYLPLLVTFLRLAHGAGADSTLGRINFGVGVGIVGVGVCGVLGAMWSEWVILGKRVRKIQGKLGKRLSQINQNLNTYYRNRIALNTCDGLIFLLIPATIGFYNAYLSLSLALLLIILKLKLCLQCLNVRPSFYQFLWFLAIIIQVGIVVCYFIAHLISSFPILPSQIQLPWLLIIRYYSLSLPFLYLAVGFIYFVMMMWEMGFGVLVAWRMLRCKARVANQELSHQIVISGEHMIADEAYRESLDEVGSGITIVNKLRDKVDKCTQKSISIPYGIDSQQKISNPFVSTHLPKQALKPPPRQKLRKISQQKNQKNFSSLHQPAKKVRGSQEKRLKIVTMKGIEPAPQEQQQDRTRCKSSYGEEADGKIQKPNRKTNLKKPDEIMSKSMKLIKKLDLSKAVKLETIGTEKTNKQMFQSNFEKEEAFS